MFAVEVGGQIHVACQICRWRDRVRPRPQGCRDRDGIDAMAPPPGTFIAAPVKLAMVQPADRDGEPVADFSAHRPLLGKLDVVRIRGGAAADEAGLSGYKPKMVAVALTYRLANDSDFLRIGLARLRSPIVPDRFTTLCSSLWRWLTKLREPPCKCSLDSLSIFGGELIFEWEGPVCPQSEPFRVVESVKLGNQLDAKAF
jgi:hypothetical protein